MQTRPVERAHELHSLFALARSRAPTIRADEGNEDSDLTQLIATFELHGGILAGDAVADLMRSFVDQPMSKLARWIVSREIVTIVRRSALLVPMFQFDRRLMELRPRCREAVLELSDVMGDVDLARWFAAPNSWLAGAVPVEMFDCNPDRVVEAARADRFIRCGW